MALVYASANEFGNGKRARPRACNATGTALAHDIRDWGRELGFDEIGIAGTDLSADEARLLAWLAAGRHGTMDYMARHGVRRARPARARARAR